MAVRFARVNDIPALVALGRHMHGITRFKAYVYDETRVANALRAAMEDTGGRYVCLVAESGRGAVVGVLLAVLERHIFSDQLTVSIMHYDVLPDSRMGGWGVRLLRAFEQWAANRHVFEISFGVNSGGEHERVGRFAARMGFEKVGENFVKSIPR